MKKLTFACFAICAALKTYGAIFHGVSFSEAWFSFAAAFYCGLWASESND